MKRETPNLLSVKCETAILFTGINIPPPPNSLYHPQKSRKGLIKTKLTPASPVTVKRFEYARAAGRKFVVELDRSVWINVVLVLCFISVECRKDKVFCVICEKGLKANKSQIRSQFRSVCGPWARTCQSISMIFFRFDITFAREVYHLGIKMKTNMTIVLIRHVKCMRYLIRHVNACVILIRHVKCMGYFNSQCKMNGYFNLSCKMYHLILTPKKRHSIQVASDAQKGRAQKCFLRLL